MAPRDRQEIPQISPVFLGHDQGGSFAFHIMQSGAAPKISNDAIDELLNEEYTQDELKTCVSRRITWKHVDMVGFRLPRHTLLYFGSGWSYVQSGINADDEITPWDVKYVAFSFGKYI